MAPPSPLMEAVRLLHVSVLVAVPLLPPLSCFVLRWGASAGLGRFPPSPVSGHAQRARTPARRCPPLPLLVGWYPSLPLLHDMRRERTLLRGCPPFLLLVGGPPPLPLLHAVSWERMLLRGCPTVALLVRGSLNLPLLHAVCEVRMLKFGWDPPPPHSPGCALGLRAAWLVWTLLSPARARVARATGWGVPPPPPSPGRALGPRSAVDGGPPPSPGCAR